jgi:hypothetical protein
MTTVKEPPIGPNFSPPPCSDKDSDNNSNQHRCQFTFSDGRRCRNSRAPLCAHHASKQRRGGKGAALKAPELEVLCADLTTATNINRALAQTFLLMAQGRISRKDAVAFGYLSQLMLQSVSGVRAEYVAAFGYSQWENKLKTSLMPGADDDPEPSPGGDSGPLGGGGENLEQRRNGVVERQKGMSIRPLLPHKESERGIPPKPFPVNNSSVDEQRLSDPFAKPDYGSLLRRSLDMLSQVRHHPGRPPRSQ